MKPKIGEVQAMVFKEADLPPFYAPDTPKTDTAAGEMMKPKGGPRAKTNAAAEWTRGGGGAAAAPSWCPACGRGTWARRRAS